jgi:uncharacterized surface protein with fasciclin (FAS1) repeats
MKFASSGIGGKPRGFCKVVLGVLLVASLVSCGSGSGSSNGTEIEFSNGSFLTTLVEAQSTSLFARIYESVSDSVISVQSKKKTLIAPNNAAVEKYLADNSETLDGLISKPDITTLFVLGHLLDKQISATELLNKNGEVLTMLNGSTFTVDTSSGRAQLISTSGNSAIFIAIDLPSSDGIVHIVDSVLAK